MSRLQSKCMFGSAVVHLLLLAILIVGSAFVSPQKKVESVPLLHMFDASRLTDDETSGGGTPAPAAAPAAVPVVVTPPPTVVQQAPPEPVAKPVEPVVKPQPVRQTPPPEPVPDEPVKPPREKPRPRERPQAKTPKPTRDPEAPKVKPVKPNVAETEKPPAVKHQIEPNFDIKKPTVDLKAKERAQKAAREERERIEAENRERERAYQATVAAVNSANAKAQRDAKERAEKFASALASIQNNSTGSALIEMPGLNSQAYYNYSQVVWSMYYDAWRTPEERSSASSVRVEIVIAKDGRVISAEVTGRSGDSAVDKSVREALDRVRKLPPFPEGATDEKRIFKITFNLKAKRQIG